MKQLLYIVIFLSVMACGPARKPVQVPTATENEQFRDYAPDRLIIMYADEIGKEPLLKAIQKYKAEILYDYSIVPGMAIRIPEGANLDDAIKYFKRFQERRVVISSSGI